MIGMDGVLSRGYNLSMLGNSSLMPIEKFYFGLYMYDDTSNDNNMKEILDYYDVICVVFNGENPYNYIYQTIRMMMSTKEHTFVLSGVIDNNLFNILLDYSFETGNKVVYCENNSDLFWKCFIKYRKDKNKETYYIMYY